MTVINHCPTCARDTTAVFDPAPIEDRLQITSPEDAAQVVLPLFHGLDREHCLLINLDTKHRVLSVNTVSVGSVDHTFMSPREVYRDALIAGAAAIFLAHNHPSGDHSPSADDRMITRRLAQAGTTVGVDLLDHLVVAGGRFVSLAREGVL